MTIYEWAKKYHKHGFSVIPVGEDKRPLIEWKKYQEKQATEEQIRDWFGGENPPNIGIVTGKISGVTVVDVENGGEWRDLPSTMTVKTGGGGVHLYYKYADGVGNAARIRHLTDIRGDGGYVVAPPSTHKSGNNYEWIKKERTQPFPFEKFGVKPKKNNWTDIMKGLPVGKRNTTASKVVGKLIQTFPPSEWNSTAWEILVMWNLKNDPPLGEVELRTVFNSITGKAIRTGKHKREDTDNEIQVRLISDIAKDLSDELTVSYPTGYKTYDDAFMGGFKEGDLVVISGYTGQGKTHFAQSITHNLVEQGFPCLWFSYEVTMGELWRKFKNMGVEDSFLAYAPEKLATQKIDFVTEKIIEARDTYKTKVVFIDHLGFLANDPSNYDMNLTSNYASQLTVICRRLKSIALSEGVIIVLLAHLKKPMNPNSEPTIHDLKDSSGVAQEADSVILISRQKEKSGKGYVSDGDIYSNMATVRIEKNRRTGASKMFTVEMINGRLLDDDQIMGSGIMQKYE